MFCTKCGKDNGDVNKFCIECGSPLDNTTSSRDNVLDKNQQNFDGAVGATTVIDENYDYSSSVEDSANQASFYSGINIGSDKGTTILGDDTRVILTRKDGKEFPIKDFPAIVGKGSAADVIIPEDESISRQHFCIHEYGDDGFVIEDLESTNKTILNNNALEKEELVVIKDGDSIQIGETFITVGFIDSI